MKKISRMGYFDDIFGNSDSFSDNLKEGNKLVTEGQSRLIDGDKIEVVK